MRYGSFSVETSYQPSGLPRLGGDASGVGDQAVDERDVGAVQLALADERDLDVLRHEDLAPRCRPRRRRRPSRWRRCRRRAPTASARRDARARVTAADRPRALNELVGLSDSSLTNSRESPSVVAEPLRVDQRRPALAERERLPRRRRAASARGTATSSARAPASDSRRHVARRVEVVAGEQGSAAGAEVLLDCADRTARRRTAREHSRWVK